MPRQRKIVTEQLDPQALYDHSIQRNIKLHSPFEVVNGELVGLNADDYAVVYTAPLGGKRELVASRSVHKNAIALRNMLDRAWAQGFYSSGRS